MTRRSFLFRCFVTCLVCGGWLCGVSLLFLFAIGGFSGFVACFCGFSKVANVLNMLVFPCFVLLGVVYSCFGGFGRFSVRWGVPPH